MPILVTTAAGRILHATSEAACAFRSYSATQEVGGNAFDWISQNYTEEKSQRQIEQLRHAFHHGSFRDVEPVILTANDQKSWRITLMPQMTTSDTPPVWLWVFRDTSSSRLLEQHERHSEKMGVISRFAGGMAHEFNNLLTAILGNLELMRMDVKRPISDVVDRLDAAERASMRVNQLIHQLRLFAGRDSMTQEVQLLLPVVQRVRSSLSALCDGRITITQTCTIDDSERMSARFNAEQLEDALMRLGKNAVEAIGDLHGKINFDLQIVSEEQSESLQITIEDTGVGMPPGDQNRAFEPFFSTKDPNTATGLGMAVAYGLIEEMNGAVQISNSTQSGTDVRVTLPISPLPAVAG